MIALVNKEILDLRVPLLRVPVVTKALEWGLTYALFNFVFDSRTFIIKQEFLSSDSRSLNSFHGFLFYSHSYSYFQVDGFLVLNWQ
jgi:hypothetical protein